MLIDDTKFFSFAKCCYCRLRNKILTESTFEKNYEVIVKILPLRQSWCLGFSAILSSSINIEQFCLNCVLQKFFLSCAITQISFDNTALECRDTKFRQYWYKVSRGRSLNLRSVGERGISLEFHCSFRKKFDIL